ncbi:CHAD domain-containing protein [Nitrosomonas sp.]|uniref:CHAD domain-containing protein n=2 Tax=Nitrosomonas sp. TaxID=42353 RepID=UPI00284134C6|nr:CHAD domain-containing protein [Nitrosomonas sp.]MDR4514932.1 CHAD domain-containing protein [Nitrosomonas sp.]
MKSLHNAQFVLAQQTDSDAIFTLLQQEFALYETDHTRLKRHYLDSFDWRMYRRNYVCTWHETASKRTKSRDGIFFIHDKKTGSSICELPLNSVPRFSKDVNHQTYRKLLDDVLGIRALMTVAVLTVKRKQLLILNEEHKTLVLLQVEHYAIQKPSDSKQPAGRLIVCPVRGYEKVFKRVMQLITGQLKLPRVHETLLDEVLAITGQAPDSGKSAVNCGLKRSFNTWEAERILLQQLFGVMQINEPGLREAIDTEFLHDYRVAVRRVRSMLGQIKHVLPDNLLTYFKREFSWLGSVTTPTRDLDMYLLKFDGYVQSLPKELQQHLEKFRLFLQRHWKIEHARLCRVLDSKRYRKLVGEWQKLLANVDMPLLEEPSQQGQAQEIVNAAKPASIVARQRIWKLYKRILKEGGSITPQSHDEDLHELRKSCKKFRYLIEFFQAYYSGKSIKKLLKTLKQLQDNLGDFQDLCVQIGQLNGFAEQMQQEGLADTRTIMAMGVLVEKLNERKMALRAEFGRRFESFTQPENKAAFVEALQVQQLEGVTE